MDFIEGKKLLHCPEKAYFIRALGWNGTLHIDYIRKIN
jgi:hypothetical protein